MIGLGYGFCPKYEGSGDYRARPVPLINYQSGSFFISPRAGLPSAGIKMDLSNDWSAGVFLGMGLGRKSNKSSRLEGMDDIDFHGVAGVYTEWRSEEHTSELQSLMRISYAVFCLKKKQHNTT